jgi:delta 1-pyrroline-5-carboxylate dehydrogenase
MTTRATIPLLAALSILSFGGTALAGDAPKEGKKSFLVKTTHTPEQCLAALDEMAAKDKKLLAKMDWGCMSGDHSGYVIVQAADEKGALAMLPEANRATATAEMVTKFTPEQIKKIHEKVDKK